MPVFNNWVYTNSALSGLLKLLEPECNSNYEIIVIDNNSSDETPRHMSSFEEEYKNKLRYRKLNNNYGFGYAINVGYQISSGDHIMILNNDIKYNSSIPTWIDDFVKFCKENPNSLIGPSGGYVNPKKDFAFCYETKDNNKLINYMSGWCLTASRETWNKLILNNQNGPFDTDYFLYFEDTDLSIRAKKLGINFILHDLPLVHLGSRTSSKFNMLNKYYQISKKIFTDKWKDKI